MPAKPGSTPRSLAAPRLTGLASNGAAVPMGPRLACAARRCLSRPRPASPHRPRHDLRRGASPIDRNLPSLALRCRAAETSPAKPRLVHAAPNSAMPDLPSVAFRAIAASPSLTCQAADAERTNDTLPCLRSHTERASPGQWTRCLACQASSEPRPADVACLAVPHLALPQKAMRPSLPSPTSPSQTLLATPATPSRAVIRGAKPREACRSADDAP